MKVHEIKSLISVPQVLGMYGIEVKKRIPCPIHGGKKNNFAVHEEYFKCFSCGESGDIFSLVQSLSQVDFLEAKKIICDYFNIVPPSTHKEATKSHKASLKRITLKNEYKRMLKRVRTYQEIHICEALRSVRTLEGDSFLEQHLEGLLDRFSQKPDFFIAHDIHAHVHALLQRYKEEKTYIFNNINIKGVTLMSYMVLHMNKFKADAVKGIENHNSRSRQSHSNPDIDYERSTQNYELHENATQNYAESIQNRIDDLLLVKAVRKDAVRMCGLIVSSDTAFFEKLSLEEQRRFFEESKAFLSDFVGKENVIAATVHMDEKTPHMHFMHVPITKDGRLNANSIYTRESLRKLQSDLPEHLQSKGFDIQRGVEQEQGAAKKHLHTREYKQQQEELKKLREQEEALRQQMQEYERLVQDAESFLQENTQLPDASFFNYKAVLSEAKEIIKRQREALLLQTKHKNSADRYEELYRKHYAQVEKLRKEKQELYDKAVTTIETQKDHIARLKKRIDQDRSFITQPNIVPLHEEFWAERRRKHEQEVAATATNEQSAASAQQQSTHHSARRMR